MSVLTTSKDNFEKEVMECDKTVPLDFWVGWCAPCRMVAPVIMKNDKPVNQASGARPQRQILSGLG